MNPAGQVAEKSLSENGYVGRDRRCILVEPFADRFFPLAMARRPRPRTQLRIDDDLVVVIPLCLKIGALSLLSFSNPIREPCL